MKAHQEHRADPQDHEDRFDPVNRFDDAHWCDRVNRQADVIFS